MSATFTPKDQAVRDEVRTRLDANLCIEAGAGTGKTSVLVDRIVRVLAQGRARVQEVAVITFTEKAAAELAGRVRAGLEQARETAGDAERACIDDALAGLDRAHIETIHAFAASLLRERPVEAGLDPNFEVLDVLPAQLAFEAAYGDWLAAEMTREPPPPALVEALNLGLGPQRVREAAETLHRHRDLLPLAPYTTEPVDLDAVVDRMGEEAAALLPLLGRVVDDEDGAYLEALRVIELHRALDALRGRDASLRRALVVAQPASDHRGNQGNWRQPDDCRAVKGRLRRIGKTMRDAQRALKEAATAALAVWLQDFVRSYDARRKHAGKADFQDLLIWARDLLRNDAEVRLYFQAKFACVLVDEFQDTDPLQIEMIVYLCEDGAISDDWRGAKLRPGSLFVVGDPKQSIYRFRRADIAVYDEVKRRIFGADVRAIVQNFRSAEGVVAWANRTFEALFHAEEGVQPEYIPLEHHPRYIEPSDAVTVLRPVEERRGSALDVRRIEAEALASLVHRSVAAGAWTLRDGAAAGYRDVAVLIPNRTDLHVYEEAFARAGVPYRHEGGRTFFQRQEVRELVAILRAIDDPTDHVATVAALRSSAFGCSDEELFLYRASGALFDQEHVPEDAGGAVAAALRTLCALARLRRTLALPVLVRRVLDDTRLVEFAMLQPQGEQTAANLLKIIDQARAFADAGGGGLRAFVRWLKLNVTRTVEETDAPISEETDDVVRIVTIHASKGLEFPVVVFANMNTERADRTKAVADRDGARLHLKLGSRDDGFVTPGFEEAEAHERRHAAAEELRLLYVAATRARDRLVVPFVATTERRGRSGDEEARRSLNDWLRQAGAHHVAGALDPGTLPPLPADIPVWRRPPPDVGAEGARPFIERREAWQLARQALVDGAGAPLDVRTASALKEEWEHPAAGDGVRRGRAVDFGSAVHALLERIDLHRPADAAPLAAAVGAEFGLRGREAEIERVARRALDSDVVSRARRSPRVLRETPFTVPLPPGPGREPRLAEGQIDLLFDDEGQLVIVDFKTDAVSAEEVEARAGHYRAQALVYAWAAHAATGIPVREAVFLFARVPREWTLPVDAAFLTEAEALLGA